MGQGIYLKSSHHAHDNHAHPPSQWSSIRQKGDKWPCGCASVPAPPSQPLSQWVNASSWCRPQDFDEDDNKDGDEDDVDDYGDDKYEGEFNLDVDDDDDANWWWGR